MCCTGCTQCLIKHHDHASANYCLHWQNCGAVQCSYCIKSFACLCSFQSCQCHNCSQTWLTDTTRQPPSSPCQVLLHQLDLSINVVLEALLQRLHGGVLALSNHALQQGHVLSLGLINAPDAMDECSPLSPQHTLFNGMSNGSQLQLIAQLVPGACLLACMPDSIKESCLEVNTMQFRAAEACVKCLLSRGQQLFLLYHNRVGGGLC